jgi:CRP-like cAMP-binding protein
MQTPTMLTSIPQRIQCLSAADLFCDLSHSELEALSKRAPVRHVEAKTVIYTPDDPTETVFMVNAGQVQLYQLNTDGRLLTNGLMEAGALFGEMALLGQSLNGHFAQTVTSCVLCVMTLEDVRNLLLSDLRISNRLVELLGKRLLETHEQLSVVTLKLVPARVAWALCQLLERHASPTLTITHETIGTMVGANRETVTKVLNDFRAQGLIELRRGHITVLNAPRLRQLAEE